jgi:hypothetical protein
MPWSQSNALVAKLAADKRVKALTARAQFIALLFAQLKGRSVPREIVDVLNSRESHLYHLGAGPVARGTLADANHPQPGAIYEQLFGFLVHLASPTPR